MKRVRAEILSTRRVGAYRSLTLVAPEIAERARPGQFLSVKMPEGHDFLLRRHFAIHQASRRGGWAGTLEFVIEPDEPGAVWLAQASAHEFLDVIGPLGKGFAYPKRLTNCVLIAERRSAAPVYFLAQELLARHKRVDMIVGAETMEAVFKPIEAKRLSQTVAVRTVDGSLGEQGAALDALEETVARTGAQVLYAAGSLPTLREVASFCAQRGLPAQIMLDEPMPCGFGLCFACAVPVVRPNGTGYDNVRACVDGPVFDPVRIAWGRWPAQGPRVRPTPPEGLPAVRSPG